MTERRDWRRRTVPAPPWPVLAPGLVWALTRLFGLEFGTRPVQLVSFTPYAALASLVPLAVCLATKRWWPAAVAGLATVALAARVLPRSVGGPAGAGGVELRVM